MDIFRTLRALTSAGIWKVYIFFNIGLYWRVRLVLIIRILLFNFSWLHTFGMGCSFILVLWISHENHGPHIHSEILLSEPFHYRKRNPKTTPTVSPFTYIEELTGCFINNKCTIIKTQRDVEQEQSDSQEVGSWYKPAIGWRLVINLLPFSLSACYRSKSPLLRHQTHFHPTLFSKGPIAASWA